MGKGKRRPSPILPPEPPRPIRTQRILFGQAVARRKGKRWGGSKKGWRWKVSDEQVVAVHEMKSAGKKIAHIARVTRLSRPTIYRVLRQCAEELVSNGSR